MFHLPDSALKPSGSNAARLGHIGSVIDVIAARIPDSLINRRFKAADYKYGFELASPKDIFSLGEALIVNGLCHATSTDGASPDYNRTISGPEFLTGGMFIIPPDVEPSHRVNYEAGDSPLALMDLYAGLYEKLRQPAAIVGVAEFSDLRGTAIGRPPIDGNAIFEHREEYFPFPETICNEVPAFITGAFTDYGETRLRAVNAQLEVVLYKNPFDTDSALSSHAHVLTLKRMVEGTEDIGPESAVRVLHLFTENTRIRSIRADIYTISGLDNYENR